MLRAIGALKVVEVDDRDLGCRIAANRSAVGLDVEDRIFGQVEGLEASEGLSVCRDEKAAGLAGRAAGEGHRQGLVTRDLAWLTSAKGDGVVLGYVELRANQDFDAAIEGGPVRAGGGDWALQPIARPKHEQACKQ